MATAEAAPRSHGTGTGNGNGNGSSADRPPRKRPFAGWMKRLANLKPSHSSSDASASSSKAKKAAAKNNPYPQSSAPALSSSTPDTPHSPASFTSADEAAAAHHRTQAKSTRSNAPTVATVPDTLHSKAETGNTHHADGSTFSSPNASEHSLTTTLTTIQSSAPSHVLGAAAPANPTPTIATPVHFSHQFPTSPPPSAIPPHLAPHHGPQSYHAATANNVLSDDASILTLASSSKRRRRNSLDTNASVRALAPSSHYGGSRESLPLSVLSGNVDSIYSPSARPANVTALANANAERASIYSVSNVAAPALSSERNSYYANKQQNTDAQSVRSGLLGHGRTDSISSIRATPTSPLASPRDAPLAGKVSRRSAEWKDARQDSDEDVSAGSTPPEHEDKGKAEAAS